MPATPYPFVANPTAEAIDVLTAQVRHHLSGGRPNADGLDVRVVKLAVQEALDSVTADVNRYNADRLQKDFTDRTALSKDRYFETLRAMKEGGETPDAFLVRFPLTPVDKTVPSEPFCLLPLRFTALARYQNLPGEEMVRAVYGPPTSTQFVPTRAGQARMLALYPNAFDGVAFYRMGDKVIFVAGCFKLPDTVTLEVVIRDRPEDQLPEAGLQVVTDLLVISKALEILGRKGPVDKINNDNSAPQQA